MATYYSEAQQIEIEARALAIVETNKKLAQLNLPASKYNWFYYQVLTQTTDYILTGSITKPENPYEKEKENV